MVQVKQLVRPDERRAVYESRLKALRKTARHGMDRGGVDRERVLRALLDEAHERIRALERVVKRLTAAL